MLDRKASAFDFENDEERRADEEAMRAYEAGRVVDNETVCAWLSSWGKPGELPHPTQVYCTRIKRL